MVSVRSWGIILLLSMAVASEVRTEEADVEPVVSLDVAMLLKTASVFPSHVRGGLWVLQPVPGRRLVVIPLRIRPTGDEPIALKIPSVALRGGRFLCWWMSDDDEVEQNARLTHSATALRADSRMIFGAAGLDHRPPSPTSAGDVVDRRVDTAGLRTDTLPEDAPRMARKLILTPQGQVTWKLDRSIPGTRPTSSNSLYALKARPDMLRDLQPERPTRSASPRSSTSPRGSTSPRSTSTRRTSTGGDAKKRAAERRETAAKYRRDLKEFRDLKAQVLALPETFSQSVPKYIWAVFDVPLEMDVLSFGGPSPRPWRITIDDLTELAETASRQRGGGDGKGLDGETYSAVLAMTKMIRDSHPLTHRLVAATLARSHMAGRAQRGDLLDRMIHQLIASPDTQTRRTTISALANVLPPTRVTASMLRDAAASMTPDLQLISLRGLMNGDTTDPQQVSVMLETIRPILIDPQGPDAGDVLEQVSVKLSEKPEAVAAFAVGIDFDRLSPQRLDQAIRYIISAAPSQPMAAAWLDRGLLGAFDSRVPKRTLEIIVDADRGPSASSAVTKALLRSIFGSPSDVTPSRQIKLDEPIFIDSSRHALLNLLQSGDTQMRNMAWQALLAFDVAVDRSTPAPRRRGQPAQPPDDAAIIDRIMRAALDQTNTPTTLTSFFSRQVDNPHATAALVRLVIAADAEAARSAAGALLGSMRAIDTVLDDLTPPDRWRFALRMYQAIEGEALPVVGLMRDSDPRVARWLADRITRGSLPNASEWAGNFKDEAVLVRIAGASDKDLAKGAVAALVFAAGGDRFAVTDYIQRFATLNDRTEAGMTTAWKKAKQDIFAHRLTSAAGTYTFILIVHPPDVRGGINPGRGSIGHVFPGAPPGVGMGAPTSPGPVTGPVTETQTLTLATVELIADGSSVRFRHATVALSIPSDAFAIRMNNAGDLKNFSIEDLATIDLQSIREPIDLFPQPDGSWKGEATLRDGSTVEIHLEPNDTF